MTAGGGPVKRSSVRVTSREAAAGMSRGATVTMFGAQCALSSGFQERRLRFRSYGMPTGSRSDRKNQQFGKWTLRNLQTSTQKQQWPQTLGGTGPALGPQRQRRQQQQERPQAQQQQQQWPQALGLGHRQEQERPQAQQQQERPQAQQQQQQQERPHASSSRSGLRPNSSSGLSRSCTQGPTAHRAPRRRPRQLPRGRPLGVAAPRRRPRQLRPRRKVRSILARRVGVHCATHDRGPLMAGPIEAHPRAPGGVHGPQQPRPPRRPQRWPQHLSHPHSQRKRQPQRQLQRPLARPMARLHTRPQRRYCPGGAS